jgi:hypothetical protein
MFLNQIDSNGLGQYPEAGFYEQNRINLLILNIKPSQDGKFLYHVYRQH